MYSGNAEVVPLVASEKNVEACVVSSESDQVYDDCTLKPFDQRRRRSTMTEVYQLLPSELLSSMVDHALFGRGVPAGMNTVPSPRRVGTAVFTSLLRSRCLPRDPA